VGLGLEASAAVQSDIVGHLGKGKPIRPKTSHFDPNATKLENDNHQATDAAVTL
jgi:hypothetical protein